MMAGRASRRVGLSALGYLLSALDIIGVKINGYIAVALSRNMSAQIRTLFRFVRQTTKTLKYTPSIKR